ncbi:MAG: hypothetical protein RR416_03130 [Clostridia bacterium]
MTKEKYTAPRVEIKEFDEMTKEQRKELAQIIAQAKAQMKENEE